ncbi:hypothetical protein HGRIS_002925 [Hohenbuehelia grisea]|uniref:CUE domain-containing protein n=1 Tax=Hohenbuehelia grisea TaxID=104357 RepID=A0ABR3JMH0_9AGAR
MTSTTPLPSEVPTAAIANPQDAAATPGSGEATPTAATPAPVEASTSPGPQTQASNPFEPAPVSNAAVRSASPSPSSAPEPVAQNAPAMPPRPTGVEEAPADPRVAGLRAMFPDFDDMLLLSVLESVGWDQDRAIDTLLGMNDPEYKPASQAPVQSQTDLDEQLARRLMLEEQEQQQAAWRAAHPQPPLSGGGYEPAPGGGRTQYQTYPQQGSATEGPSIASDLQEQFTKVAEAGKKTFGSLLSKVKAKMQEFDAPRQSPQSTQPTWGTPSAQAPYAAAPAASTSPVQSPAQQPAYYDPNPYRSPSPSPSPHTSPIPPVTTPAPALTMPSNPVPISSPASADATRSAAASGGSIPASGISPSSAPIDGGKLGLLPKRPVSLLRPSNETPQAQSKKPEDDDELEYAENPFEEGSRK